MDFTVKAKVKISSEGIPSESIRSWFYLATSIELAPDLKKSVESSIMGTLLKIPAQMTYTKRKLLTREVPRRTMWQRLGLLFTKPIPSSSCTHSWTTFLSTSPG